MQEKVATLKKERIYWREYVIMKGALVITLKERRYEALEAEVGNSSSESCDLLYICTDVYRNNIYIWPMDGIGIIIQLMSVGA